MANDENDYSVELLRVLCEREQHRDRLALEREKWEVELNAARKRRLWDGAPLNATVVVAVVGALLTGWTAYSQISANRELERSKYESQLILKALEPADSLERVGRLAFLVHAGLISDPNGKISRISRAERLPQFRDSGPVWPVVVGNVRDAETLRPMEGVEIRTTDDTGLTRMVVVTNEHGFFVTSAPPGDSIHLDVIPPEGYEEVHAKFKSGSVIRLSLRKRPRT